MRNERRGNTFLKIGMRESNIETLAGWIIGVLYYLWIYIGMALFSG